MGRCAVSTQKQKRPFALRALAAFAGTLAILFVLLLAAYALPGERVGSMSTTPPGRSKTRGCTRNIWASSSFRWTITPTR